MAKVEMTLKEYDELREELNLYKRALTEICTAEVRDWDIEWYNNHPGSSLMVMNAEVSDVTKDLLKGIIFSRIPDKLRGLGNIDYEDFSVKLCSIYHTEESEVESGE